MRMTDLETTPDIQKRMDDTLASEKPYKGRITNWEKVQHSGAKGLGYIITGVYVDHPSFRGETGYTSYVTKHDEKTGEIETKNSRYTLVL